MSNPAWGPYAPSQLPPWAPQASKVHTSLLEIQQCVLEAGLSRRDYLPVSDPPHREPKAAQEEAGAGALGAPGRGRRRRRFAEAVQARSEDRVTRTRCNTGLGPSPAPRAMLVWAPPPPLSPRAAQGPIPPQPLLSGRPPAGAVYFKVRFMERMESDAPLSTFRHHSESSMLSPHSHPSVLWVCCLRRSQGRSL